MNENTTSSMEMSSRNDLKAAVSEAVQTVGKSFENLCLLAGVDALATMMDDDVNELADEAYERNSSKPGYRWGRTKGRVGFHGGKVEIERPRVRSKATGAEMPLPSWQEAAEAGWLEEWATSMMLMNVATRKMKPAMRLPEAGVPSGEGAGLSRSAASRRFKVLTEERMAEWMSSDLSELDLLVIQIDGMHISDNLLMIGALGIDKKGVKHALGVVEGATENAATVQALLDNLVERGLDPQVPRLFIVDGAKALSKAINFDLWLLAAFQLIHC